MSATETEMPASPECARMVAVAPFSQHVGDFLDWLRDDQGFVLAKTGCPHGSLDPAECEESRYCRAGENNLVLWAQHVRPEQLLAAFYGIDLDLVETERQAILDALGSGS